MKYPFCKEITYSAVCEIDDKLFFSSNLFNGLFCMDINAEHPIHIGVFPGEKSMQTFLHLKAFQVGEEIAFVPRYGNNLYFYNIKDNSIRQIKFHNWKEHRVVDAFVQDGKLWIFFSHMHHGYICFDLVSNTVISTYLYNNTVLKDFAAQRREIFANLFAVNNGYAYSVVWNTNCVCRFNLNDGNADIIEIGCDDYRFCGIAMSNNCLFCTMLDSNQIICYDLESSVSGIIDGKANLSGQKKMIYASIFAKDDFVVALPEEDKSFAIIDAISKKVVRIVEFPSSLSSVGLQITQKWRRFYSYRIARDKLVINPFRENCELIIDFSSFSVESLCREYNIEEMGRVFEEIYKPLFASEEMKRDIIYESEMFSLEDFLKKI